MDKQCCKKPRIMTEALGNGRVRKYCKECGESQVEDASGRQYLTDELMQLHESSGQQYLCEG